MAVASALQRKHPSSPPSTYDILSMRQAKFYDVVKPGKLRCVSPQVFLLNHKDEWHAVVVRKLWYATKHHKWPKAVDVEEVALSHEKRYSAKETEEYNEMLAEYLDQDEEDLPEPLAKPKTWRIPLLGESSKKLYCEITSAEIVARIEEEECWFCGGDRNICAGCTGGIAQRFDLFMTCGTDLACPNCMGLDIAREDKKWQLRYFRDEDGDEDGDEDDDEEGGPLTPFELEDRPRRLNQRLEELGYNTRPWRVYSIPDEDSEGTQANDDSCVDESSDVPSEMEDDDTQDDDKAVDGDDKPDVPQAAPAGETL